MLGIQTDNSKIMINEIKDVDSSLKKSIPSSQEQLRPQIIRNISIDDDPMIGNPNASNYYS